MKVDRLFHRIHRQIVRRRKVVIIVMGVVLLIGLAVGWLWYQGWLTTKDTSDPVVVTPVHQVAPSPEPVPVEDPVPTALIPDYILPAASGGLAPVIWRIPTELPVVYLTIDDGANKTQEEVDLLKQHNLKATLFLAHTFIQSDPDFFKATIANGAIVENHSLNHDVNMSTKSYEYQKAEICGMADLIEQYYGRRPTLFRPPGGAYTDITRQAAHDCGMTAVVTWIAKANGGAMQYQVGSSLRPGDIVLMHFRPEFQKDLTAFLQAMDAAGLQTELLEDIKGVTP